MSGLQESLSVVKNIFPVEFGPNSQTVTSRVTKINARMKHIDLNDLSKVQNN